MENAVVARFWGISIIRGVERYGNVSRRGECPVRMRANVYPFDSLFSSPTLSTLLSIPVVYRLLVCRTFERSCLILAFTASRDRVRFTLALSGALVGDVLSNLEPFPDKDAPATWPTSRRRNQFPTTLTTITRFPASLSSISHR